MAVTWDQAPTETMPEPTVDRIGLPGRPGLPGTTVGGSGRTGGANPIGSAAPVDPARRRGLAVWPARPAHAAALERLFERCSHDTMYRRFHGVGGAAARRELARIVEPTAGHRSWVAVDGDEIRGTVTLATGRDGVHEIGILVEDDWFRHGVGRALMAALLTDARRRGLTELVAWVQSDNMRARNFFHALAPGVRTSFESGEIVARIPLRATRWGDRGSAGDLQGQGAGPAHLTA